MTDRAKDNLVLFPKTLDYYQIRLTKMLETERYGEAKALLGFLLQCGGDAQRHHTEWQALLGWLETAFPDAEAQDGVLADLSLDAGEDSAPETEADLARQLAEERLSQDAGYVPGLLEGLRGTEDPDQQKLIISQLMHVKHPDIEPALREWLAGGERHPSVQFLALQTLRNQGASGLTVIWRNGDAITPEIEETPASFADFPQAVHAVIDRVRTAAEVSDPTLSYFAEEMWKECVQAAYGTQTYETMAADDDSWADIWAAALHQTVLETLHGHTPDDEVREMYGITDELRFRYEQSLRWFRQYAAGPGTVR